MSMQYQGSVTYGGTQIYVTSATATINRNPISPEIVWGGGWKINYANGHIEPTVSLTFPWFSGYSGIVSNCIDQNLRSVLRSVIVNNGGTTLTMADSVCQEISWDINALGNEPISCTATFVGKDAVLTAASGSASGVVNSIGLTPVPAYAATANLTGSPTVASSKIVAVRISASNNVFRLFTLNGLATATDLQLGLLTVTGSVTYYSVGVSGGATTGGLSLTASGLNLSIPSLLYNSDGNSITGPNNKPMRELSFEGFGMPSAPPITG